MKKFLWTIFVLIVGVAAYSFWPKTPVDLGDSPQGALNRDAVPTSYDLALEIDPNENQFTGEVKIAVDLTTATNRVWLHGRGLSVQSAELILGDQRRIKANYKEYGESGVAEVVWAEAIPPQSMHIHIQYQAEFSDNLNGLYKVNDDNRQYAFTQMEATHARQAFPSFDDPQFKTPFNVKITAPKDLVVIANTPELKKNVLGEKVEHVFATSKPLPTYLLAWAVGELDVVEWQAIPTNDVRSVAVPLRGIATKGKGKDLNYALENTARIFDALEHYFQIPYPYEKLDLIAVPDFDAGAMENAGAITYREQLLLLKDDASAQQRRSYFTTHTHELAHQWFGNLVTMPWWNDLWLNESFATWMENKIVKQVVADLGYKLNIQSGAAEAMESDLLKSTREIRQPIHFNHEISAAFDGITYAKGGAVLAMFERFVGEEVFRQGIENYLKRYAFGSATAEQFVAEIANAANDSRVNAAFFSFLTQVGIPQLEVQSECKDNQLHISAKQQRFLPLGSQANANQAWQFPVCVASYADTGRESHCTLMTEAEQQWTQAVTQCPSLVHFNGDGAGYYLVKQSVSDFATTFAQLDKLVITEAYVSAKSAHYSLLAGHINQNEYVSLVPAMVKHPEREIMTAPLDVMQKIKQHTAGEQLPAFKTWLAQQWSPALTRIGVEPTESDSDDTRLLRTSLLNFLLETAESHELRADFKNKGMAFIGYGSDNKIHEDAVRPDIRRLAMSVTVNDLGAPYFEALTEALDSTSDGTIRNAIIGALGSADDKVLAEEARDMVTGLSLRVNERVAILGRQLMRSPERAAEVFDWFKGKYSLIKGMLPESIQDNVPMIGMFFCSEPKRQEVQAYFTPLMPEMPGAQRALDNTLETIHLCSTFVDAQPALNLPN